MAPQPSRQNIPAPMPPIGNATRLSRSPSQAPSGAAADTSPHGGSSSDTIHADRRLGFIAVR